MDKTVSLNYTVKPLSYEVINKEFSLCRCYILATGKNRNYSYISKEAVQAALPSLMNIPVVAHIKKGDDNHWYVGGHDRQIIIDDSGITVNDLTIPYGVVHESCNPEFVTVQEKDGSTAEYLVASLILWSGRYPILDAKSQTDPNVLFNESMEILAEAYSPLEEDKQYTNITEFSFSALCLLGRDLEDSDFHTEPCFPSSRVEPVKYDLNSNTFKNDFELMKAELQKLSLYSNNKFFEKEVKPNLDEKLKILEKFNVKAEDLDFNIEEISVEELESKLNEKFGQKEEPKTSFSATYNQKRDAIRNALDSIIKKDANDNIVESEYFYLMDFDETWVYVERDYWNESGDFEETHGRFAYTFDEESLTASISGELEPMFLVWLTAEEKQALDAERANFASIKSEFDAYKEEYKTKESDVEELRSFKTSREDADRKVAEEAIFDKFKNLSEVAEYKTLKENASKYDLQTLEKELCFLLVKNNLTVEFSKNDGLFKVGIDDELNPKAEDDNYGGLFIKYARKKKN
jgi:hypothetical protein